MHRHGRGAQHSLGVQDLPGRNDTRLGLRGPVNTEEGGGEQDSRKIMLDIPHDKQRKTWALP